MDTGIYRVEKEKDITILTLILDNITMYQNEELQEAFTKLLDEGTKNIVLDLSKTDFISSIVIASLVFMLKRAREAGGDIVLCGVGIKVRKVLAITNLDRVFDIYQDRKEAVGKLAEK